MFWSPKRRAGFGSAPARVGLGLVYLFIYLLHAQRWVLIYGKVILYLLWQRSCEMAVRTFMITSFFLSLHVHVHVSIQGNGLTFVLMPRREY